jgi:hypothetical protein
MTVVGIDTASNRFHWVSTHPLNMGIVDDEEPMEYGWAKFAMGDIERARASLYWMAKRLFSDLPDGSAVMCEEPLALPKNPATTRKLCMAAAAVWCGFQAISPDATWYWVDPASWKKAILGRGMPPRGMKHKPWVEQEVQAHPGWQSWADYPQPNGYTARIDFVQEPDLYDAWCLKTYGVRELARV